MISDTHGLVRSEALAALEDSDLIVHAGDVGKPEVLEALKKIAPVVAVRGNTDRGEWAKALPHTDVVRVGGLSLYVVHDVKDLDLDPVAAELNAVISGHSHRPRVDERAGVMFLNPGSAGPRRFNLPVALARLHIRDGAFDVELIELDV